MRTGALTTKAHSLGVQLALVFYTGGFYVYSLLVYYGMPAYLRGFLVLGAAICIPFLLWPYLRLLSHPASHHSIDAIVWSMLGYFLVWMLAIDAQTRNSIAFNNYLGTIISWGMLFMLGRVVPVYGRGIPRLAQIVFAALFVLTLANMEDGAFTPAQGADAEATYQAYAVVLAVVTFVLLYDAERAIRFWAIGVTAIVSFAILGSRSELVAMLLIVGFAGNCRRQSRQTFVLEVIAIAMLVAAYVYLTNTGWNRLINLVDEGAESTVIARSEMTGQAWTAILNHPMAGDFGSYDDGAYAHNLLSIWVDFGFFGMLLYVALLVASIHGILVHARVAFSNWRGIVSISLWGFCVFLLVFTKPGHYFVVPFVMGVLASTRSIMYPKMREANARTASLTPAQSAEQAMRDVHAA